MSGDSHFSKTRTEAAIQARELLGVADLGTPMLFQLADSVLGQQRGARSLHLARQVRLTRRVVATSAVAELVVGTRDLGIEWWSRVHREMVTPGIWEGRGTPDELLTAAVESGDEAESRLRRLSAWIADDAADPRWGRPVDYVDLNDPTADDRIHLPESVVEGERLVVAFDPGARVWAKVVRREGADASLEREGRRRRGLGSVLTELAHINVEDVGWAYNMATNVGPIYLPGEAPGGPTDPFVKSVDPDHGERLSRWAINHDRLVAQQCQWITKGDVWSAYFRLGLPYSRTGEWWAFDNAASALVDDVTANFVHAGAQPCTGTNSGSKIWISSAHRWTLADVRRGLQNRLRGAVEASRVSSILIHPRQFWLE